MSSDKQESDGKSERESYIHEYDSAHFKKVVGERTAAKHGAFFLPYLHSGMTVLDCGCGPGLITIGLAEVVEPGLVVGMDIEASQVESADSKTSDLSISNLRFETGDVYQLTYADNTFDAVFSHALLEHLNDPLKALREMHRVLKPGGIVGVRSSDFAGVLIAPSDPRLDRGLELYCRFRQHNGGDPYIGRRQRALLRQAGFHNTKGLISCDYWGTTEETTSFVDALIAEVAGPKIMEQAIELNWVDESHFEETVAALKSWSRDADSFFSMTQCEAVGWKN